MHHLAVSSIDGIVLGGTPGKVVGEQPTGVFSTRETDRFLDIGDVPA